MSASGRRKLRNALLTLLVGVVIACAVGELAIRFVLFQPGVKLGGFGASLRQAGRFADGDNQDDYWKLVSTFQNETDAHTAHPDPVTGWTNASIAPGTYAHEGESLIGERRPVLLYGDSFAHCGTPPDECFQTLLEQSELGREYAMLNYGVVGYGLDQMYLLLRQSIDRHAPRNPVVIVAILVESDFERSVLSFRGRPKPRLDIDGERLVSRGPVEPSTQRFLEQNPISIHSYLWRLFLHHDSDFLRDQRAQWRGDARLRAEKQALNRRILLEIEHELSSRNLQHFYLAFHSEPGAVTRWVQFEWQEEMLVEVCKERALALVDTRAYLAFAAKGSQENVARFYGHGSPLEDHLNALGNLVCFEAIRQGLLGHFEAPDTSHLELLEQRGQLASSAPEITPATLLGRSASVTTHGAYGGPRAVQTSEPDRLNLRADSAGTTEVSFELAGAAQRFRGLLHTPADTEQRCPKTEIRFSVKVDGEIVLDCAVPSASAPRSIEIDLVDRQSLALIVSGERGGAGCSWINLDSPRLE